MHSLFHHLKRLFFRLGRGGFAQTILSGVGYIAPRLIDLHNRSMLFEFDTTDKNKFRGYFNKSKLESSKALVILLHGWEGSSQSSYILKTAYNLHDNGFDVFRLDFLDHGDTHSWNEQIFHGNLLQEHFKAIEWISQTFAKFQKVHIIGFSLGGNYSVRIALSNLGRKIPNLHHTIAISPALNPEKATIKMDQSKILGRYFLNKWMNSIDKKVKAYPGLFNFEERRKFKTVMDLTDYVVRRTGRFDTAKSYFDAYTVYPNDFNKISSPITLITAKDDPIIPVEDFENLSLDKKNPLLNIIILPRGGHNGFFTESLSKPVYLKYIQKILSS
ncbi:MAG: alpha/beta fold hydrolase [Leptospiraceae bacterium]|nr:alpha/beta fold hydrolase [Leptospiraceae bacterium]